MILLPTSPPTFQMGKVVSRESKLFAQTQAYFMENQIRSPDVLGPNVIFFLFLNSINRFVIVFLIALEEKDPFILSKNLV